MTSREIVKRAIHFNNPERIAYNYDSNRNMSEGPSGSSLFGDDFIWCFLDKPEGFSGIDENGDKIDEWGCVWKSMGETFGEPTQFPLEGLEEYADTVLPDFLNDNRYNSIRNIVKQNNGEKYVMGMLPTGIFQIMIHLFGFEDFMYQIAGNTEEFANFTEKLCDMCIAIIDKMADCGVDGIILIEDMGLQDRMMISPTMWKEIYFPLYQKMFAAAHRRGIDTISHTCGHIVSILDMYIESGLDVIQMDQQDNMGLELLSEKFSGKVCFFCSLDIQNSIDYTKEQIFAQTEKMAKLLSTPNGGFMAKTYPQPEAIHITNEYMQNMADGFAAASKKLFGK